MAELIGDRSQYRKVFQVYSQNGKITPDDLSEILKISNLGLTLEEEQEAHQVVFGEKNYGTFEDFLKLFKRESQTQYSKQQWLSNMRLLTKNKQVTIEQIGEILKFSGAKQTEINAIIKCLKEDLEGQSFDLAYLTSKLF